MSRPRTPLHQRLDSLVKNDHPTANTNTARADNNNTMRPPRMPTSRRTSPRPAAPSSEVLSAALNSVQPVLRWLGASPSDTPPSSPTTTTLKVLDDALHDDIDRSSILRKHDDHLPHAPEAFRPSRALARPPTYFDNLTRSTLPTSSLSVPNLDSTSNGPDTTQNRPTSPILLATRRESSIDTLRNLQSRSIHSSPPRELSSSPPSQSWWPFSTASKEEVDPLLAKEDQRDDAEDAAEHLRKKYIAPEHPIVFCHGLMGFDQLSIGPNIAPMQVTHWRGIREALEQAGAEVLITRVPATSSPVDRAKVLADAISEKFPGKKVHLIGHSMGGVDCRYLTTHITKRNFSVLSVTTIASPHRGSAFADYFLSAVGRERLPSVMSLLEMLPDGLGGGDGSAFDFLTLDKMQQFNEQTPDAPGVQYFSWGAWYDPGLIDMWKWSHSVILEKEGPNDGLVSVESAKWGTYLGTLENVSHLDLVGWTNPARYRWAEIMGREIRFKPATFYLGIADHIARIVEGKGAEDEPSQGSETPHTRERRERNRLADHVEGDAGVHVEKQPSKQPHQASHLQSGSAVAGLSQHQHGGPIQASVSRRAVPRAKQSGDDLPIEPSDEGGVATGATRAHVLENARKRNSLRNEGDAKDGGFSS